MSTAKEVIRQIEELRGELAGILVKYSEDEGVREQRIRMWAERAREKLAGWGFSEQAQRIGGRNSSIQLYEGVNQRAKMRDDILRALMDEMTAHPQDYESKLVAQVVPTSDPKEPPVSPSKRIFLGHGRSKIWARVQIHLKDDLGLDVEAWESQPRAGHHSVGVLKNLLASTTFAVIVATGEDVTAKGELRARQNVVHEIGLFQGHLGFEKVALLEQEGIESFSNLAGLQVIPFQNDRIEAAFYELDRMLKRERLVG